MKFESAETKEYKDFVDKFKPKLTTDDCYTPENVYAVVRNWAVEYYGLKGREIVRPFWPGGDYENYDYPDGCVVIDNPPFSIISKIRRFYVKNGINYFLFAPALTLFSDSVEDNYLPVGVKVTYENGAGVCTSFVTNLGDWKIDANADLYKVVQVANNENLKKQKKQMPKYSYPPNVLTAAMAQRIAHNGITYRAKAESMHFIRSLESQRRRKKGIFGSGFLLSEKAAAEKAAAEKAAAEKAAAEKAAAEKWTLSDDEWTIVRDLK